LELFYCLPGQPHGESLHPVAAAVTTGIFAGSVKGSPQRDRLRTHGSLMNDARWAGLPYFAATLFQMAKAGDQIANAANDDNALEWKWRSVFPCRTKVSPA
jgi:hypothetical protein